ncbi:N,N'-diacetylbacillosaminyl-diphospho-undecaprenol alpha-1,3-N-acetylgalactosaminyltransferase [Campylobacter iguaniorum]|uniref:N, N'-diacetylbacillosaminyl-diphospho-undecaprenol alpha-1,3-N-acetylgalactosaminyltransferase n=1 Tax=Campylobacter iguaniorum TaxID=1244531 RepID=A0A076FHB7_9BACT|nr:N,N'-diacetylbacillosaminyl-diphospho-undecaprenol alpha-1,3-N-acetylgalactosaminyltransferase [Campylobacter iguaniorum]AII15214.1 N,N'-diacetylbacillosaminyl-diphospho-undecaprenol alpha-1,3-N-acetylgalactosaminyltransferase [Campylobacter iguaniorum]
MARIGFLSHSDMSVYYFRAPIMRALKERGHEVFAIIPDGAYAPNIKSEFKTIIYELDKASLNPLKVSRDTQNLALALEELSLDMLQTGAHKSNVFGTFAAKKVGIKTVINLVEGMGSFYIHNDLKSMLVRKAIEMLYKKAFKMSDACVFVNDSDPDYMLSKSLIEEKKVRRIKSVGVNANLFDPKKVEAYKFGDKKVVLMMGRALWDKGVREFYEAANILKDRLDCEFVFVGDTYEGNPSSATSEFLRNQNVKWIKWSDNVKELLKGAYIYALPSYKEGFPRTVLEAMSMAKACVVSGASGCVEAVEDGVNGLVCKVKDSADLAKKIEILLDDEKMVLEMGQNGRKLVLENYDEPIIVEKYLKVYKEFLDV